MRYSKILHTCANVRADSKNAHCGCPTMVAAVVQFAGKVVDRVSAGTESYKDARITREWPDHRISFIAMPTAGLKLVIGSGRIKFRGQVDTRSEFRQLVRFLDSQSRCRDYKNSQGTHQA